MLTYNQEMGHFLVDGQTISLSPAEIEEMNSLKWWHSIPFAPNCSPEGICDPRTFIDLYMLDKIDFRGKSVLDIGCWDGFQLFYAEAMGARRVVGVDDLSQRNMGGDARDFAKDKLKSNVEFLNMSVYDLSPKYMGSFDIVMMFGVLYHLVHPMLGIEKACGVCKGEFLMATHYLAIDNPMPICVLYPTNELDNCHSNWCGPSRTWITQALQLQGFEPKAENTYHSDRISFIAERADTALSHDELYNATRDTTLLDQFKAEQKS